MGNTRSADEEIPPLRRKRGARYGGQRRVCDVRQISLTVSQRHITWSKETIRGPIRGFFDAGCPAVRRNSISSCRTQNAERPPSKSPVPPTWSDWRKCCASRRVRRSARARSPSKYFEKRGGARLSEGCECVQSKPDVWQTSSTIRVGAHARYLVQTTSMTALTTRPASRWGVPPSEK